MKFRLHAIASPGGRGFGQTSAVDVDRDGDLDFISGRQFGDLFWNGDRHVFVENLSIHSRRN